MGAFMNVKINASGYKDKTFVDDVLKRGEELEQKAITAEAEIIALVNGKMK
jgi:glutamate formiminotransferase/formiminotetrahydrofolate cyclodeaminase